MGQDFFWRGESEWQTHHPTKSGPIFSLPFQDLSTPTIQPDFTTIYLTYHAPPLFPPQVQVFDKLKDVRGFPRLIAHGKHQRTLWMAMELLASLSPHPALRVASSNCAADSSASTFSFFSLVMYASDISTRGRAWGPQIGPRAPIFLLSRFVSHSCVSPIGQSLFGWLAR